MFKGWIHQDDAFLKKKYVINIICLIACTLLLQACASTELEKPEAFSKDTYDLYFLALDQGDVQAQLQLGEMYAVGHEVSQD
jgi:TPR repeat protein